jgi:hypothetical protein
MGPIVGELTPCPRLWRRPAVWTCPTDRRPGSGSRSVPRAAAGARAPGTRGRGKALRIELIQKRSLFHSLEGEGRERVDARWPKAPPAVQASLFIGIPSEVVTSSCTRRWNRNESKGPFAGRFQRAAIGGAQHQKPSTLNVRERKPLGETGRCLEQTSTR